MTQEPPTINQETQDFFTALWPAGIPDHARLLVWTLPNKISAWCTNAGGAALVAGRATAAKAPQDVYVGAALGTAGLSTRERGTAGQTLGIPGLWIDLDYAGDAHKKQNLPSEPEAMAFINELADTLAEPTLTVHSGHGLQLWWLLDVPYMFDTPQQRQAGAQLEAAWLAAVRSRAAAHGWEVDATQDLARVLRVPGTVNRKIKAQPVPVRLLGAGGPRYTLAELLAVLPDLPPVHDPAAPRAPGDGTDAIPGQLLLSPTATPPFGKFVALTENEPRFKRTWERKRLDYQDQSPSAYDMGLASFAVAVDWSDQEITDLLIAHRRHHGDDLKLRDDYYRRTLARARAPRDPSAPGGGQAAPDDHSALLALLSAEMFPNRPVAIESIVKYQADPPTYVLNLMINGAHHEITLGKIEVLITMRSFRGAVAAAVGVLIADVGKAQWERRVQQMLDACEVRDLGDVATAAGQVTGWIEEYLEQHKPAPEGQMNDALNARRPYLHDGHLAFHLNSFAQWLNQSFGERMTRRELARYLRMAGYEQYTQYVAASAGGNPSTRSVWRKPITGGAR